MHKLTRVNHTSSVAHLELFIVALASYFIQLFQKLFGKQPLLKRGIYDNL